MTYEKVLMIIEDIRKAGGTPYFVGGYVRDTLLGMTPDDYDIEVFGLTPAELQAVLAKYQAGIDLKGAEFGVFKLGTADFSIARIERKTGHKHTNFAVTLIPSGDIKTAAKRRDFTINAIYMTPAGDVIDPYDGYTDLVAGRLRVVSEATFADDPLRVLRGMQFAGRFDMVASSETMALARSVRDQIETISKDRIWLEWFKWAEKSTVPSKGLEFLVDCGWLPDLLAATLDLPQDPDYHPEGSVWSHILACVDVAQTAELRFAALVHDLGKISTTKIIDGKIVSPGHATAPEPAEFLAEIGMPDGYTYNDVKRKFRKKVLEMVKYHMYHYGDVTKKGVRRLMAKLQYCEVRDIVALIAADYAGRPPYSPVLPQSAWDMLNFSVEVADEIEPIFKGRHLLAMGYREGPFIGEVCDYVYELQLDGVVRNLEDAQLVAEQYINEVLVP